MARYFRKWRLQPSVAKTEVSSFHLNNRMVAKNLNVYLEGRQLPHNKYLKYLEVTLDRTLLFKEHLLKPAAKLKTKINILQKYAEPHEDHQLQR